jgi:hypothetical protein
VFRLTKKEKQILAFVMLAFLVGWGFRQWLTWRESPMPGHETKIHEFHEQFPGEN